MERVESKERAEWADGAKNRRRAEGRKGVESIIKSSWRVEGRESRWREKLLIS